MIRPYKFQVIPVVQEIDDSGSVVAEHTGEPITVFGCDGLKTLAERFPSMLPEEPACP